MRRFNEREKKLIIIVCLIRVHRQQKGAGNGDTSDEVGAFVHAVLIEALGGVLPEQMAVSTEAVIYEGASEEKFHNRDSKGCSVLQVIKHERDVAGKETDSANSQGTERHARSCEANEDVKIGRCVEPPDLKGRGARSFLAVLALDPNSFERSESRRGGIKRSVLKEEGGRGRGY